VAADWYHIFKRNKNIAQRKEAILHIGQFFFQTKIPTLLGRIWVWQQNQLPTSVLY